MKKQFLIMFALLCTAMTVCAQKVTDLSQLSNDKVYFIRSERAFLLYSDNVPGEICTSTGKSVGSVSASLTDPKQQFRIEKSGANYYLFSVGAGKYVSSNGSYESTPSSVLKIEAVDNTTYPWKLCIGNNGMNSQISGQMNAGITVSSYTTTDAGNCYYIEEAIPEDKTYTVVVLGTDNADAGFTYDEQQYKNGATIETTAVIKASDLKATAVEGTLPAVVTVDRLTIYVSYFAADTKFYTIHNNSKAYISLNEEYCNGGNFILTNTNPPRDNKALWAFVSAGTGKYKIYNYSCGLSKVLGITGDEGNARTTMVDTDNTTYSTVFSSTNIKLNSTEPSYINIDGTNKYWNKRGDFLALWNSSGAIGDNGSKFFIEEADIADYPDEYFYEVKNITGVSTFSPKNPNTLWYKTSAEATGVSYPWMEYALPLGNGELGCMIFGGVFNEEIQFNEKTLWSGEPNVVGAASGSRTFMNFGSVFVENKDKSIWEGVTDYVRYLDIEEGIAGVEFKNGNGSKFTRKYLSSAPAGVIAARYTAEGDDKMNLKFTIEPGTGIGAGAVTYENGMAVFTGSMHVKYAARLHVVADNAATVTSSTKGIVVSNATEVTFYLKGETNFDGDVDATTYFVDETTEDISARAKGVIEAAVAKGYEAIETEHIADFTAITKRMTFDLGLQTPTMDTKALVDNYYPNNSAANSTANDHLFLEQLYFHYGRYLAISSNRKPIAAPNNLQGIWNDRGAESPWNSDIHTNINIQMNYWPTEITNLSDLHKPFVNHILRGANSEGWKKVGTNYNGGHGWSVLTEASMYYSMSTWGNNYLVANVWYTSHLWTHWRYTQDKEFLKKAFPVMWDCAEFWFHRLIEDKGYNSATDNAGYAGTPYSFEPDGTFVAPNEYSAEQNAHDSEDGTAHAQQMISYLFQNLSDAIEILGVENTGLTTEEVAKLNEYLQKTDNGLHTEIYTANSALNGGWTNPRNGVNMGDTILREWKYSPYDVSNDPGHRHLSHLMALFPLDQITPESEYFTPAVNSLKLRGDAATGWSMGWKVNLWARALDGDHAHIIIKNALKHSTSYGTDAGAGGIYYNLFDSHAPFQIDGNFGVCSGIAEMLLQSAHGYINILPALPTVWERQGEVKGMKAIGNFTVDFNWADGKCQNITIISNAGSPLKVRCTRSATELNNAIITVDGVEVDVTVDENGIVTIPCGKGSEVKINFLWNEVKDIAKVLKVEFNDFLEADNNVYTAASKNYYRFTNTGRNKAIGINADGKPAGVDASNKDFNQIWQLQPDGDGFKICLPNQKAADPTKAYISAMTGGNPAPAATLVAESSAKVYRVRVEDAEAGTFRFEYSTDSNDCINMEASGYSNGDFILTRWGGDNSLFTSTKMETVEVELKAASIGNAYASLYLPYDITNEDTEAKAYVGGVVTENAYLSMLEAASVKAENGFVMEAPTAKTVTLKIGPNPEAQESYLDGTTVSFPLNDTNRENYLFFGVGKTSNAIGFYKAASSINVVSANRAYADNTNALFVNGLRFLGDITTGIEGVKSTEDKSPIFDLSGRRIQNPIHKGIYINAGKKFIVK